MSARYSFEGASSSYDESRQVPAGVLAELGRLVAAQAAGGRWLDLGAGTGRASRAAVSAGLRVVGIDVAPAMLTVLRQLEPSRRIDLVRGDFERLPFRDGTFAGALAYHVLHLTSDPAALLGHVHRALVPGGPILWLTDVPGGPGLYGRLKGRYAELVAGRCAFGKPASTDAAFVADAVAALGGAVVELDAPLLSWDKEVLVTELLELFRTKAFSVLFPVPDEIHRDVMRQLAPWAFRELPPSETMPFRIRACRIDLPARREGPAS